MVKDIEDMYNKEIVSLAMSKPTLETEIDRMIEDLTNLNNGLMDKNLKLVNNESAKRAYSNVTKLIGRLKQAKVALEGCK